MYLKIQMLSAHVVVEKVFRFNMNKKKMTKIIFNTNLTADEINDKRLFEGFLLKPEDRIKKMFQLIKMSLKLKSSNAPKRESKGLLLLFK